jgi:putative peptide zinc metalloprotease protein
VTELKPWVRVVVTAYVCVLVPVIAFMFLMLLINAPRVFATGWDSFWAHWDRVGPDFSSGATARGALTVFQMLILVLPAAGIVYTTTRVAKRFGTLGWRWSDGSPARRTALMAGAGAAAALAAFLLWPHSDYRPIQPGERGTLVGAIRQLAAVPSGRAALTPQRAAELGGAPSERQLQREGRSRIGSSGHDRPAAGRRGGPNAARDKRHGTRAGTPRDGNSQVRPGPNGARSGSAKGAPGSAGDQTPQPKAPSQASQPSAAASGSNTPSGSGTGAGGSPSANPSGATAPGGQPTTSPTP